MRRNNLLSGNLYNNLLLVSTAEFNSQVNANDQLLRIARKLMWWQEPQIALSQPMRFIMQVMTLGNWGDVQAVSETFGWEAFREALLKAEPGVFDKRSWVYWHAVFGLAEKEMPRRTFGELPKPANR